MVEDEDAFFRRAAPPKGKLHKGVVLQNTRAQSTIPTKSELEGPPPSQSRSPAHAEPKKGFSSTAHRTDPFAQTPHSLQTPGPGSYAQVHEEPNASPSTSKKGLGNGFVSEAKRFPVASPAAISGPAPGQYYDIKKESTFNISAPKKIPNYSESLPPHEPTPGPGNYNPHDPHYPSPNTKGSSSFLTTAQRVDVLPEHVLDYKKTGPGKYNPADPRDEKVSVSSPFRSHTKKGLSFQNAHTPGPGAYRAGEAKGETKKTPKGKLKNSAVRASSAEPARPSPSLPTPGPGEYLPLFDPPRSTAHPSPSAPPRIRRQSAPVTPGSSFASRTQRTELIVPQSAPSTLGPGVYHADTPLIKQSFNTNRKENWV